MMDIDECLPDRAKELRDGGGPFPFLKDLREWRRESDTDVWWFT